MKTIWLLIVSIMLGTWLTQPVTAQCATPSGWQPYTITRGDNLYRIAFRFRTTVALLQSGNCLTGTRIFVGQRLYVPATVPVVLPTVSGADQRYSTGVTFQWFERGFMLWRSDTSDIWVYEEIGEAVKSRNRLTIHPVSRYGSLAVSNILAPAGLLQPVMGFGKVWSNLNNYRQTLGWATQSEMAYTLQFRSVGSEVYEFSLPDGAVITRYGDGFWSNVPQRNTIPTPYPTAFPSPNPGGPAIHIIEPSIGGNLTAGMPFSVSGDAAGIFEASFVLELWAVPSETLLTSQIVTYITSDVRLPGTWQVSLTPSSYIGSAEIRAKYIQPSDGTPQILSVVRVNFT